MATENCPEYLLKNIPETWKLYDAYKVACSAMYKEYREKYADKVAEMDGYKDFLSLQTAEDLSKEMHFLNSAAQMIKGGLDAVEGNKIQLLTTITALLNKNSRDTEKVSSVTPSLAVSGLKVAAEHLPEEQRKLLEARLSQPSQEIRY